MADTAYVKYVYLDVVAFTKERSVEAQSDVVAALNEVVRSVIAELRVANDSLITIPTGDGMAIALVDAGEYDAHLSIALGILKRLSEYNAAKEDEARRFEVRVGIDENVDNVILDINQNRNVAGLGISMSQRIMDQADGGQILVGQTVFDRLKMREKYLKSFKKFDATGKHGLSFAVYQYSPAGGAIGLKTSVPSGHAKYTAPEPEFTKQAAYVLAHGFKNKDYFTVEKSHMREYVTPVLLWFLAEDSVESEETPPHSEPSVKTKDAGPTIQDKFKYYSNVDYWMLVRLAEVVHEWLGKYSEHFEYHEFSTLYWLPKTSGLAKLWREWPHIAEQFNVPKN